MGKKVTQGGCGEPPPPRVLQQQKVNRGGGGAGAPRSGGWAAQNVFVFTDYNNNIIPPTTWGVNPPIN